MGVRSTSKIATKGSLTVAYDKITIDGLTVCLDPGNSKSYTSGSSTMFDLTKYDTHATLVLNPTYDSGSLGSIVLNGTSYMTLPNNANLNLPVFTYCAWLQNNATSLFWNRIISKKNSFSDSDGYEVTLHTGTSQTMYISGAGSTFAIIDNVCNWLDYAWHHLAVVFSGTTVSVYRDGVYRGQGNINQVVSNSRNLFLGCLEGEVGITQWNGKMSHTTFYDKALSSTEILQNYIATKTRFNL